MRLRSSWSIAAPASGSGKTTVATGLIGALRAGRATGSRRSRSVPTSSTPATTRWRRGRPGRNLDPVLVGEDLIGPLYRHGSADADIAVVEGVMGLFDGRIDGVTTGHRAGIHRARRRAARRAGDPGRRRTRPEPQHRRSAARLLDVRPVDPDRRGDPQPGRLAAARARCCGRPASRPGVPVLGAHPASRRTEPCRHGISV